MTAAMAEPTNEHAEASRLELFNPAIVLALFAAGWVVVEYAELEMATGSPLVLRGAWFLIGVGFVWGIARWAQRAD